MGRSTCPLLAAPAETVSSEIVVNPALHGGSWAHRLAVSLVLLLFLGEREVAVFPKYSLSQVPLARRTRCSSYRKSTGFLSQRFIFLFGTRENSLKFFSSSGLICSLSLGCREVITVVYYLVKDP